MDLDLEKVSQLIRRRRTVYPEKYADAEVDTALISEILTNATWAPSHGLTQPWRFVVYTGAGRNKLAKVLDRLYRTHTPEEDFIPAKLDRMLHRVDKSPVVLAVAMRRTENTKIPEIEEVEAVAAACQNILLSATAAGLGAFWSSPKFIYTPEAAQSLGLHKEDKMQGIIYMGYPEGAEPKSRRRPLGEVSEWIEADV